MPGVAALIILFTHTALGKPLSPVPPDAETVMAGSDARRDAVMRLQLAKPWPPVRFRESSSATTGAMAIATSGLKRRPAFMHSPAMRGPLVYGLEDKDLPKGVAIENVRIESAAKWPMRHEANLLHGVMVLETQARVVSQTKDAAALYRRVPTAKADSILSRLIPYYAWCNRGVSEMTVWLSIAWE